MRSSIPNGWTLRTHVETDQDADPTLPALTKLSIVIPARDEEGCIASTIEHLHVELRLHGVPHEIIVVDDGSTDRTWEILEDLSSADS